MTIFSKYLPMDMAMRVWDLFLRDGECFLFSTALGVLKVFQTELLKMPFESLFLFLKAPPKGLTEDTLFQAIASVQVSEKRLTEALSTVRQRS